MSKTLNERERAQLEYVAEKYTHVSLRFNLKGKVGAVFQGKLFPAAMMGDLVESGYVVSEVREGANEAVEMVVEPRRLKSSWPEAHEYPLRP